jgi:hypothetical protein
MCRFGLDPPGPWFELDAGRGRTRGAVIRDDRKSAISFLSEEEQRMIRRAAIVGALTFLAFGMGSCSSNEASTAPPDQDVASSPIWSAEKGDVALEKCRDSDLAHEPEAKCGAIVTQDGDWSGTQYD